MGAPHAEKRIRVLFGRRFASSYSYSMATVDVAIAVDDAAVVPLASSIPFDEGLLLFEDDYACNYELNMG